MRHLHWQWGSHWNIACSCTTQFLQSANFVNWHLHGVCAGDMNCLPVPFMDEPGSSVLFHDAINRYVNTASVMDE